MLRTKGYSGDLYEQLPIEVEGAGDRLPTFGIVGVFFCFASVTQLLHLLLLLPV